MFASESVNMCKGKDYTKINESVNPQHNIPVLWACIVVLEY